MTQRGIAGSRPDGAPGPSTKTATAPSTDPPQLPLPPQQPQPVLLGKPGIPVFRPMEDLIVVAALALQSGLLICAHNARETIIKHWEKGYLSV